MDTPSSRSHRILPLAIGTLVGVALAAGAFAIRQYRQPPPPLPPVIRLAFAAPPGAELGAGDEPLDAAISPDEHDVVFVATTNGVARLWRRALESPDARAIARTDGARLPAWKQTGHVVSFFVGERLEQVSLSDGAVRDLADAPGALGASWLADGSILFASSSRPIHRLVNGNTSDATSLHAGDRGHVYPMATGTHDDFVYTAIRDDGRRIVRLHADGQDRDLAETTAQGQLVADRLIYARQGAVLVQHVDPKTHAPTGRTTAVAVNVGAAAGRAFFVASPRVLLTASAAARARQFTWYDGDRAVATVGDPGDYWQVRLSPDDRFAAITYLDPLLRTLDIMSMTTSGAVTREAVTNSLAADSDPVWSPDGTRVLFRSLQNATPNLYTRRVHVSGAQDEPFLRSELDETPSDWNGADVLFSAPMKATGLDVWQFDENDKELTGLASTSFNETDARFSPNGEWIAYVSDESGRPDIYAQPYPDGDRVRVSFGGGSRPRWSADGKALYFVRDEQIMRSDFSERPTVTFAPAVPVVAIPGARDFDVAHRSSRLAVLMPVAAHNESTATAILDWTSAAP